MKAIKISEPIVCPFCGSPVIRLLEDGAHLYCSNPNCDERKVAKLNYFVTKECMNIDGLSEKTLRKISGPLNIRAWYDLYNKTYDDFISAGLGEKTSLKIYNELQESKTKAPAENVMMALGIPNIGKINAKKLLETFGSIENLEQISKTEPSDIINILGEVAGQNVIDYMKSNSEELQYVYKYLNTKYISNTVVANNILSNKIILATGTLNNFSREGIKESVIENGGAYASGISKKLDYLIVGTGAGSSKLKKAEELGVKQITEDEYLKMIS